MLDSIRNKRVLITGASGGIGSAMVRLFADHGASVGIHYHLNAAQAESLRDAVRKNGKVAQCFQADLTRPSQIHQLMDAFMNTFKGIDVLINNAGAVVEPQPAERLSEHAWDLTFALNVKAPFFLAQAAFPHMQRQGAGRIINVSSVAAKYGGSPVSIHYGAAKAALETLTVGLARWGAPAGIRVTAIRGGFIDTPFHQKMDGRDRQARIEKILLKRPGQPMDIARMALFLASEAGDFITGETVAVAGGD